MRIHFIQHVPFEEPAALLQWANEKKYTVSFTRMYEAVVFPAIHQFDLLIILGGPMGVYEEEKYAWLREEKKFIAEMISAGKKVLGICLGAQLLAECLGAKVYKHTLKEIGWHAVEKIAENELTKKLPSSFTTFHWHGDTFDLPKGAVHLFKSSGCAQQGFLYKKNIAAIQFHFEVMENLLNGITAHERSELVSAPFVQTEEEIKAGIPLHIAFQQQYLYNFMDAFIKL